ncbi:hypothetical protein P5673_028711 [Acropora cervicornis]|uniref:Uncharacterized protein n=1 Tax=Acropora cervicornis TaxID=6130 RepID=A0AAD9PX15_ACRCE|nr:hypothetical protein P5673_028711 [Acropora cervicornis]
MLQLSPVDNSLICFLYVLICPCALLQTDLSSSLETYDRIMQILPLPLIFNDGLRLRITYFNYRETRDQAFVKDIADQSRLIRNGSNSAQKNRH